MIGIEKKKGDKEICEVKRAENFSKLMTDTKPQIQEAQTIPSTINTKKSTSRHIIFRLQRTKDRES